MSNDNEKLVGRPDAAGPMSGPQVHTQSALTDRLRRAATVSDAGPAVVRKPENGRVVQPATTRLQNLRDEEPGLFDKPDREVILELKDAIQELITDTPLPRPRPSTSDAFEQKTSPAKPQATLQQVPPNHHGQHTETSLNQADVHATLSVASATADVPVAPPGATPSVSVGEHGPAPMPVTVTAAHPTVYAAAVPVSPPPYEDESDLNQWLTRGDDEPVEPQSRMRVVALCCGTMVLSILAGYGSAQMLNVYRGDAGLDVKPGAWISTIANTWKQGSAPTEQSQKDNAALSDETSGAQSETSSGVEANPERVRVLPAQTVTEPYRVASIADVTAAVPAPEPAQVMPKIPAGTAVNETSLNTLTTPDPAAVLPSIPGDEQEQLYNRAVQLLADRDIAAARLMLRHLAESGSGPAAHRLAQTFDPQWLATNDAADVPANPDMALRWYGMARDRGESGTETRIEALQALRTAGN